MSEDVERSANGGGWGHLRDTQFDGALQQAEREDEQESLAERKKFRNKCLRAYRDRQHELVLELDRALPVRRKSRRRNIGSRALGTGGRALLTVLEDTIEYLRSLRASSSLEPAATHTQPAGTTPHREALLRSRSIFVVELENPWVWTITAVGQGAAAFFRDAPLVGRQLVGQSLAHMMRCEDLPTAFQLWPDASPAAAAAGKPAFGACIHLIDFSSSPSLSSERVIASADEIDRIFACDPLEWDSSPASGSPAPGSSSSANGEESFKGVQHPVPQAQYMRLEGVQVTAVRGQGTRAGSDKSDRVLLIGTFGETGPLPLCSMCRRCCCYRVEQTYALEVRTRNCTYIRTHTHNHRERER